MRRVISHIKRLFRKFWFFLLFAFAISPVIGIGLLIVTTILSLTLFSDPIDAKDPADYFTKEELRKLQEIEKIEGEEFLTLLAKYQSFECPIKVDKITTWTSAEVTKDAYICNYEINDRWHRYEKIDMDTVKSDILSRIDKEDYKVKYIIDSNRNMVFRYWNHQTETIEEIVLTTDELRNQ